MGESQNFRNPPIIFVCRSSVLPRIALQVAVLVLLVYPFVSSTFRDNDQATILSSSWQIAHGQATFWHARFYNFDKQWGVFLLLSWLFRLAPHLDPVLAANLLLTSLVTIAWIALGAALRRVPLALVLPVLLAPALILYMPYLGTAWFSLAFLLLAFICFRLRHRTAGLVLVAIAAACRADVLLALPALAFSLLPRQPSDRLVRRTLVLQLAAAGLMPLLLGRWFSAAHSPDSNPYSFDMRAVSGFLLFGLSPVLLLLLVLTSAAWLTQIRSRRRTTSFYVVLGLSPWLPLIFYLPQLYTLRYFFLTIASLLFVLASPRTVLLYRSICARRPWLPAALIALTLVPWLIGIRLPDLRHPRLTATDPTRFPTGDGLFPMAAYLAFDWQVLTRDHLAIDHNQKIWLAARSVAYHPCPDGRVPFLITPMSNFLELAIRLAGQTPLPIDYLAQSPCASAYLDARSIVRGYRPDARDGSFFDYQIRPVSRLANGQLIVQVNTRLPATTLTRVLQEVHTALHARQAEIFLAGEPDWRITAHPGIAYVVFSIVPCRISGPAEAPDPVNLPLIRAAWTGNLSVEVHCPAPLAGWARTELPTYLGL